MSGPLTTVHFGASSGVSGLISGTTTPGALSRAVTSDFKFTSRFTVQKSSWRGKYTRIFAISGTRVATIDPRTIFKLTNVFDYASSLIDIAASAESPVDFTITVNRGAGKMETMTFTCTSEQERAELLTDVQRHREQFDVSLRRYPPSRLAGPTAAVPPPIVARDAAHAAATLGVLFETRKCTYNETQLPEMLRVTCVGIDIIHYADKTSKVGEYLFCNIKGVTAIEGRPTTVLLAHGPTMKLHLYDFPAADLAAVFLKLVYGHAKRYVGLPAYRPMRKLTMEQFISDRYGVKRDALETAVDFSVLKVSARHGYTPVRRLLGTTDIALVERDPATYNTVGAYFLATIFAFVRCADDDQKFFIHFKDPAKVKVYTSPQRDAVLAHLVDACREAGNMNASVVAEMIDRGKRACSFRYQVSEDMESTLLNCLLEPEKKHQTSLAAATAFFNANIDYSGLRWTENKDTLFAENREKLIYNAIHALLFQSPITEHTSDADLVQQFQALRRLTVSRTGFSSVAVVPTVAKAVGGSSVRALRRNNLAVTYAVMDFLNTLMTPMHNHYELEHESVNKNRIAGARAFLDSLLETLRANTYTESASLVVHQLLNFFVYVLCPPFSETTDAVVFRRVMSELVKVVGKGLFPLLNHPCHAIRFCAGQLIRVVLEEGEEEQFRFMQRAALTEGGVLMEFNVGAFGKNRRLRDLARRLLAYWAFDNVPMQDLLRRMMPLTMLNYLQSSQEAPPEEREVDMTKDVSQMTRRFRESKNGWFKRSFHPKSVVPQSEQEGSRPLPRPQETASAGNSTGEPHAGAPTPSNGTSNGRPAGGAVPTTEVPRDDQGALVVGGTTPVEPPGDAVEGSQPEAAPLPDGNESHAGTDISSAPQVAHADGEAPSAVPLPVASGAPVRVDTSAARLRMRHMNIHSSLNWSMLFYQLKRNHLQPDLIWNHATRDELRRAIESELEAFQMGSELRHGDRAVAWNYQEFEVAYHSLDEEIRIGQHYYPRLLFESQRPVVARPKEFFNELYHRFLLVEDTKGRLECLHGMSLLYKFYAEPIGEFSDLPFLVRMLQTTMDPTFRDRMLMFLSHALGARHNIKLFLDCDALAPLAEMVTLAQLHIDRPQVHAVSNAIEYTGGSLKDLQGKEKEWYYSKGGTKADPVSFTTLKQLVANKELDVDTKVWAQGMSGWKPMREVPQLRWGVLCAGKPSLLTYTEVTCTILDIFQRICNHYPTRDEDGAVMQPLPRVKRYLSSPAVLPHLVQLLLTFDSTVCTRVHTLLYSLMQDNPLIGRLFLTGVFYFSLLYTASDVLPMARLLHLAHRQQSYQYSASDNAIVRSSILAPLLPPAMVCFLTHHGPEKFADVLLGDYETPEIIWGKGMRRYLAGKIAAHIADFTPRLLGNNLVQYQYCPIVGVEYEQLQHELFCSEYYLRHLCDESKYPNWPIREPINFLRDVLTTWRAELAKKPSSLTREGCVEELELTAKVAAGEELTTQLIRRAYFALAAKFHPDKNANGRERFERIQEAYEYLAADRQDSTEPDPNNIRLILRSQSILFRRYGDVLREYKYAGYGLLLALIKKEFADEKMLDKDIVLMDPATELCFATVKNVPLNTDELQEEGGMHLLAEVASECFSHINGQSNAEDAQVHIAKYCMLTFAVSAQFRDSRLKLQSETVVPYLASKGVAYHETLMPLARACIQCCETLCLDKEMQSRVTKAGAIWHLLRLLFCYDPTLEAAGVTLQEGHHAQLFANRAAVFALRAIYSLVGFHPDASYCQTAHNEMLVALLRRLLTPYVTNKMETVPAFETEALAMLNGNWETPYFLWNNTCRAELEDLLKRNSDVCRDASMEATAAELPSYRLDGTTEGAGHDGKTGTEPFTYSLHKGEVIVGGVFIRVYVAQPNYPIEDPPGLFHALLDYLSLKTGLVAERKPSRGPRGSSLDDVPPLALAGILAVAVNCLKNLVLAYTTEASAVAAQRMHVFMHLLGSHSRNKEVLLPTLSLLERLLPSEACVEALGHDPTTVTRFIFVLLHNNSNKGDEEVQLAALQLLRVMLSHRPLVQQALDRGLYVVLLLLYATGREQSVKEAACMCLGKLFTDKLVGPKIYLRCGTYLPAVFLDSMKDSANAAQTCVMLDSWQENPELMWTKDRKTSFISSATDTVESISQFLETAPSGVWSPQEGQSPDAHMTAEQTMQYTQVGGVFLSLYLQQAGWQVRKPKEFLVALLDSYLDESEAVKRQAVKQPGESGAGRGTAEPSSAVLRLNLITDCGVRLLSSSPSVRDYAASLGYMHKLIDLVSYASRDRSGSQTSNADPQRQVPITALRWLHELWQSTPCVEATAPKDVIRPLLTFLADYEPGEAATPQGAAGVRVTPASLPYVPLVLESLEELFSNSTPRVPVVAQAMSHNLVGILLHFLEAGIPTIVTGGPASVTPRKGKALPTGLQPPDELTPAATRALIIKVIKAMVANAYDAVAAEKLNTTLAQSAVWAKYKDQSHDLFLTTGNTSAFGGYLTNGARSTHTGTAGATLSLTVGAANPYQDATEPPPLQE